MANRRDQHGYSQALQAARYIRSRSPEFPRVGIVLGSGLNHLTACLADPVIIPYELLPHFPRARVEGHAGKLYLGRWKKLPVAVLAGHIHLYEGYTPAEVAFAVRVLRLMGVAILILTCAARGIAPPVVPGSLMIFSDHLNLLGSSPLAGQHDERWGQRFVDLSKAYDQRLHRATLRAPKALRWKCFEGVYAAVPGRIMKPRPRFEH